MAHLVGPEGRVVGIELLPDLAAQSRADLEALSFGNVTIITGDGTRGHAAGALYDRAIITAATWDVPAVLLDQVAGGGRVLVPVELRGGDGCDVTVLQRQGAVLVAERSIPGWFVPLQGGGQERRADALASPPAGKVTGRHSLPLGIGGDNGAAPAAGLFRAFLGRTEPGFVAAAVGADAGWRPWLAISPSEMAVPPFGLAEADGSVALWQAGELVSYDGSPSAGAFRLEVCKAGTTPPKSDRLSVEARGETVLVWHLESKIEDWSDLAGAARVCGESLESQHPPEHGPPLT